MMNKMMKKIAVAIAAATMTITATSAVAFANDGMGIDALTPGVSTQDVNQQMYVIAQSGANVRTAPSTDGRIITSFGYNTPVHVTGKTSNGWYTFIVTDPVYGGQTGGYIAGNLLSTSKGAEKQAAPANNNTNAKYSWIKETGSYNTSRIKAQRGQMSHDNDTFTVSVPSSYLALRSSAVTDPANEIGKLQSGQLVHVQSYGAQFDYVYVPATGAYGYVNNDYLIG